MNPFAIIRVPLNVRLERVLLHVPWLRRFARRIASLPLLPAAGRMRYGKDRVIEFDGRNSQFHAIYDPHYRAGYELETGVLLSQLLKGDGLFVDAGSNWGYFALFASALPAFAGACVCYEPSPSTFADLRSCIDQAGLSHRITARQVGLGASPAQFCIHEPDAVSGLAKLSASGSGKVVEVTTLDTESLSSVAVIKIDVEGMELAVLNGAVRTIREQRPFLIVENFLQLDAPDVTMEPLRWMRQEGYAVLVPLACVQHGQHVVPHHYGSPPPARAEDVDWTRMQFFRVTEANRFLLPAQLNVFGCPEEKLASLPGELIS